MQAQEVLKCSRSALMWHCMHQSILDQLPKACLTLFSMQARKFLNSSRGTTLMWHGCDLYILD